MTTRARAALGSLGASNVRPVSAVSSAAKTMAANCVEIAAYCLQAAACVSRNIVVIASEAKQSMPQGPADGLLVCGPQ